jgi:hypothetical protein
MPDNKERLINTAEQTKLVDVQTRPAVSKDVETWMERVEKGNTQVKTVNDTSGQPMLVTPTSSNPKVVLPVTRKKFVEGFKKNVDETGRWLSAFILKLIKMKKGEVEFKKEE